MLAVLIVVLGMYINNYMHWIGKFEQVPLSFKLVVLYALRIMSTLVALLNFAVYIDGSYFLAKQEFDLSNVLFIVMIVLAGACLIALFIVRNGFKDALTPVIRLGRNRFYEE
jgi:hypothetical protein